MNCPTDELNQASSAGDGLDVAGGGDGHIFGDYVMSDWNTFYGDLDTGAVNEDNFMIAMEEVMAKENPGGATQGLSFNHADMKEGRG